MIHAIKILLLGAAAGWVAGLIMGYPNKNTLNILIIGVLGSILGSYIFDFIDVEPKRLLGTFVMSLVGSCAVLWLLRWIKTRF
jgi:uncharacterized membrane protein YeaQ/YmgE (transglycosylase-associated protein family)